LKNFLLLCFVIIILFQGKVVDAQKTAAKTKFLIGFSQCTTADAWRRSMDQEMQNELLYYPDLQLLIKDAENSSKNQVNDIRELLAAGIDLLIVSPNESAPLTGIVSKVFNKGIPVILIDRKIESGDYSAFIGGNSYQIGKEAGIYAVKLLKGKGRVVEISGLEGSSPAKERHKGFIEEISKAPGVSITKSLSGEWEVAVSEKVMKNYLESNEPFDLVYAHNDVMALGAYNAYIRKFNTKNAFFIGVDGLPGTGCGIQAVMDRKLDATMLYPTGGSLAISLAWDLLNKKPVNKENILNTLVIDSTNVRALKFQTDEILNLHNRIVSSRNILDEQVKKYLSQRFWLIVALSSLFLIIVLTILLFRGLRNKAKANLKLEVQKQAITRQNEELRKISLELEEATNAKLVFFTNISHEFRTPLTLMIGPLENILSDSKLSIAIRSQLQMMLRNATRLLRMINQLMDLRKIEDEKMKVSAGEYDIISFTKEIKDAFSELAARKNINFNLNTSQNEQLLYFDRDKVDKILFNLLSNAFKFTAESGSIDINIKKVLHKFNGVEQEAVEIEIRDNGIGIAEDSLNRIFERFYQVEQDKGNIVAGTGIGLPLSKGFVDLHHGDIVVKSKKGEGSSFTVYFQLGNAHFKEAEISNTDTEFTRIDKQIFPELSQDEADIENMNQTYVSDDYENMPLLLIVEDNADVSKFIKSCLVDTYRIMTASNGIEAFEKIYIDQPDLIISDVMMPEMDGLEFTKKLKSDIRTSHIPVILLTALSSHESKIEGLETGADSYIAKPFNKKHLQVRVKQLIENRQQIRKHYQQDVITQFVKENKISQLDSSFLKKCNAIIEKHLTENEYGVEQMSVEIGLSRVHVYRKIKHLTGLTVSEFVRNIKLKKAAVMLQESGKTIAEVAYETGFSSPSYFSKCFKDLYNISPTEFVQNNTSE
jgi:signal transduction histidine kinase/DNA-binding response OmpR family regulator/ABC-type xylose transport system substrate-binding protein